MSIQMLLVALIKFVVTAVIIFAILLLIYHQKNNRGKSKPSDRRSSQSVENSKAVSGSSTAKKAVKHPFRRAKSVNKTTEADETAEKPKLTKPTPSSQKSKSKQGKSKKSNTHTSNIRAALKCSTSSVSGDEAEAPTARKAPVGTDVASEKSLDDGVSFEVADEIRELTVNAAKEIIVKNGKSTVCKEKKIVSIAGSAAERVAGVSGERVLSKVVNASVPEQSIKTGADGRDRGVTVPRVNRKTGSDRVKKSDLANGSGTIPDKVSGLGSVTSNVLFADRSSNAIPNKPLSSASKVSKCDLNGPGVGQLDHFNGSAASNNPTNFANQSVFSVTSSTGVNRASTIPTSSEGVDGQRGWNDSGDQKNTEIVGRSNDTEGSLIQPRHAKGDGATPPTVEGSTDISTEKSQRASRKKNRNKISESTSSESTICSIFCYIFKYYNKN